MHFPAIPTDDEFIWPKAKQSGSIQDETYRHIIYLLSCGYFRPGEKISLRQLSSGLNVSETPVRNALNRLIAESALDVQPNRHVRIPALTMRQFEELTDLRVMLEVKIAVAAAEKISDYEINNLSEINNELLSAISQGKTHRCIALNQKFHLKFYETASQSLTFNIIFGLWLRAGTLMHALLSSDDVVWRTKHHLTLIKSLKDRDIRACETAIEKDITDTYFEAIKIPPHVCLTTKAGT